MLPAFKDKRYMKRKGKLIFGIFNSDQIPSFPLMKEIWNELAKEKGLEGFWFYGLVQKEPRAAGSLNKGYDAIVYENMANVYDHRWSSWQLWLSHKFHRPLTLPYRDYVKESIKFFREHSEYIPCIMPNFDHSPRSSFRGRVLCNDEPAEWGRLCREVKKIQEERNSPFVFIKAWNEWGEGNYMEPDSKFGHKYIYECGNVFRK
jgi:hypothetical protein